MSLLTIYFLYIIGLSGSNRTAVTSEKECDVFYLNSMSTVQQKLPKLFPHIFRKKPRDLKSYFKVDIGIIANAVPITYSELESATGVEAEFEMKNEGEILRGKFVLILKPG